MRARRLLIVAGILTLTGCGTATRVATINRQTPGPAVATALKAQLVRQGDLGAQVTCARRVVVNVGATQTCRVLGAGTNTVVQFSFRNYSGKLNLARVRAAGA